MSAYLLFCGEWREKVKAQNPESSFGKDHAFFAFLGQTSNRQRDIQTERWRKQSRGQSNDPGTRK
ncbi:hypothetical protein K457DRAFT_134675, partial [Linnemannia elongata AG-77]